MVVSRPFLRADSTRHINSTHSERMEVSGNQTLLGAFCKIRAWYCYSEQLRPGANQPEEQEIVFVRYQTGVNRLGS